MRHSAINRGVMLDWLQVAIETASTLPTDPEIMERFGFTSPEQARTLLADLADRGQITIRMRGDQREILLGRAKPAPAPGAGRPIPAIAKADPQVDAAVDKIKSIIGRSAPASRSEQAKAASALLKPAASKPAPTHVAPPPTPVAPKPAAVAPEPISDAPAPPTRSAPAARKAVTVSLPQAVFDELARRASIDGVMPGPLAAQIVTAAMSGPGKLLVPAAGLRAAQVAGASVHDFASMLIRRGLQAHLEEKGEAA